MSSAASNGHLDPLTAALAYRAASLSVIPIKRDGSKAPACGGWKRYQEQAADEEQVRRWFGGRTRLGWPSSGERSAAALNASTLTLRRRSIFPAWCALVEAEAPDLIARLSVVQTPKGGYHVRYRCPDMPIPGNEKLATDPAAKVVLIETRGEGGYALAPGCPAECHPTGRLYEHHSGPPLERVQAIGFAERDILIRCARSFDRSPRRSRRSRGRNAAPAFPLATTTISAAPTGRRSLNPPGGLPSIALAR